MLFNMCTDRNQLKPDNQIKPEYQIFMTSGYLNRIEQIKLFFQNKLLNWKFVSGFADAVSNVKIKENNILKD